MAQLDYLDSAKRDLAGIYEYVARESGSLDTAQQFVAILRHKCRHLAALPGRMGRPRPELRADLRSFAIRGYVILFRYVDDTMEIVNVFEGHKDIEAYFGQQDE